MEQLHKSAMPMWMDIGGNPDGETAPFPGHFTKMSNPPPEQLQASNGACWNRSTFPQSQSRTELTHCTGSETQIAACEVNKQTTATRPSHETTQNILEQMLQELDRAPLITFSAVSEPAQNVSTRYDAAAFPLDTQVMLNNRGDQNPLTRQGMNSQWCHDRFYNSSGTFQCSPRVANTACRHDFAGHQQAVADRDVPCISAGHRVPLMPRGVNNLPCGRVEPALKVLQPADAPSQMTRSLMELARLVDNPPVVEQNVLPPVLRSHNSSKTQQCKVLGKDFSVKTMTPGKRPGRHPKPKLKGSVVNASPSVKPSDTVSSEVTNQDKHKQSRCKLTTKYGNVYVDQQVIGMLNVNQSGRLVRSPVIILEQINKDKVASGSYQSVNKRRHTQPKQLLAYIDDSNSDAGGVSDTSDYVPSEDDNNSNIDGSDSSTSILDPLELAEKTGLDSDYSGTSSDAADFSTCDDDGDSSDGDDDGDSNGGDDDGDDGDSNGGDVDGDSSGIDDDGDSNGGDVDGDSSGGDDDGDSNGGDDIASEISKNLKH